MGDPLTGKPGALYLIDRRSRTSRAIWPDAERDIARDDLYPDYEEPVRDAAFMTHGIHLDDAGDLLRLYAVNHGERESIEIFDVHLSEDGAKLAWVGAVNVPFPSHGNAVARLTDGTILMSCTHRLDDLEFRVRIERGELTGYLMSWQANRGWATIRGSESSCPNGLLAAPDGDRVFIANTGTGNVTSAGLVSPTRDILCDRQSIDLGFSPDNLRWNDDGSIGVAGFASLQDPAPRACKIDPSTMAVTPIELPSPYSRLRICFYRS